MYYLAITLYAIAVRLVSPFHRKAKKMLEGQSRTFSVLKNTIDRDARYIWFHAASLGEFEQGRPLIEKIRRERPEYKILLTFFSPSGYEVRKNYEGADVVCYLPFDHLHNARKFLKLAHPEIAVFIKYEFWMNYLNKLKKNRIPTYIISAIFRPNQIFFRWYGRNYRKVLNNFEWFFVQNKFSEQLLNKYGHHNITVSGDTRFDRVKAIADAAADLPVMERFTDAPADGKKPFVLVAGSTWGADEDVIIPYFNAHPEMKLIIAPHEINESRIAELTSKLRRPYLLYSEATEKNVKDADCLVIDCFGLLSTIYRYGQAAYIGGGFGKSIHNITEAAVYGMPIIFGPVHTKFREALELIEVGGAFPINSREDFEERIAALIASPDLLADTGKKIQNYVVKNLGATQIIFDKIFSR